MKFSGQIGEFLEIDNISNKKNFSFNETKKSELVLLWFCDDNNILTIDAQKHVFDTNEIVCLTEFHKVEVHQITNVRRLHFNRPFYCVLDHDSEVGCKGILFFGSARLPIFKIEGTDLETLEAVWKMFLLEMQSKDRLQQEMLQMMLKRVLILCTRVYKKTASFEVLEEHKIDIIREFNFLVEQHFKTHHSVADYAAKLHKSPKTLSNLFKKLGNKTPLQYIQERILLEARRQLYFSEQSVSDIAYELGFGDIQAFSRFFKKHESVSPKEFREKRSTMVK